MTRARIALGPVPHFKNNWVQGMSVKKEGEVFHNGSTYRATEDDPSTEPSFTYNPETGEYTCSEGWALVSVGASPETVEAVAALISSTGRVYRDFGRYANPVSVQLALATAGKYIDKDSGLEVTNADYAISSPISLNMGDILLVPSASAVLAACSVVSRKVTNTYNKVIVYTYTYDQLGRYATATADYNSSLVYTAHYADDEATTPDYWTIGADQVESLPETHQVTESFYEPLVKQSVAAMPDEGYYVYLASASMEVVISAFTATVNGGTAIKVGWGIFKNIASNFAGPFSLRVIAEALVNLDARIKGIAGAQGHIGNVAAGTIDALELRIYGIPHILRGHGAPSSDTPPINWPADQPWDGIPPTLDSIYINVDAASGGIYYPIGTTAVTDWKNA